MEQMEQQHSLGVAPPPAENTVGAPPVQSPPVLRQSTPLTSSIPEPLVIGVLALQGAFAEHLERLDSLNGVRANGQHQKVLAVPVKQPEHLLRSYWATKYPDAPAEIEDFLVQWNVDNGMYGFVGGRKRDREEFSMVGGVVSGGGFVGDEDGVSGDVSMRGDDAGHHRAGDKPSTRGDDAGASRSVVGRVVVQSAREKNREEGKSMNMTTTVPNRFSGTTWAKAAEKPVELSKKVFSKICQTAEAGLTTARAASPDTTFDSRGLVGHHDVAHDRYPKTGRLNPHRTTGSYNEDQSGAPHLTGAKAAKSAAPTLLECSGTLDEPRGGHHDPIAALARDRDRDCRSRGGSALVARDRDCRSRGGSANAAPDESGVGGVAASAARKDPLSGSANAAPIRCSDPVDPFYQQLTFFPSHHPKATIDALILPGGESTSMKIQTKEWRSQIVDFISSGKPVYGTCAVGGGF